MEAMVTDSMERCEVCMITATKQLSETRSNTARHATREGVTDAASVCLLVWLYYFFIPVVVICFFSLLFQCGNSARPLHREVTVKRRAVPPLTALLP